MALTSWVALASKRGLDVVSAPRRYYVALPPKRLAGFGIALTAIESRTLRCGGAQERTRTSTPVTALVPETSASTNSATWAGSRVQLAKSCGAFS